MTNKNFAFTIPGSVGHLLLKMTRQEKVYQFIHASKAIERLEIKNHTWWNECLPGVSRTTIASVFQQATGIAATLNETPVKQMAPVISARARARYHQSGSNGKHGIFQGSIFWSTNTNIFRDERPCRGMEIYGYDAHLTSTAVAFMQGLQDDDSWYLACLLHRGVLPSTMALKLAAIRIMHSSMQRTFGKPVCLISKRACVKAEHISLWMFATICLVCLHHQHFMIARYFEKPMGLAGRCVFCGRCCYRCFKTI